MTRYPLLAPIPMTHKPLKIEELLDRIDIRDVPCDSAHRYGLRRSLLCSKFFGDCGRANVNKIFSFTAPLLAGTVLVAVFAFVGSSMSEPTVSSKTSPVSGGQIVTASAPIVQSPTNEFIDFNIVPVRDVIRFVPIENSEFVLMR